jgi:hypothetical protein
MAVRAAASQPEEDEFPLWHGWLVRRAAARLIRADFLRNPH